jgi:hypothetical protein
MAQASVAVSREATKKVFDDGNADKAAGARSHRANASERQSHGLLNEFQLWHHLRHRILATTIDAGHREAEHELF